MEYPEHQGMQRLIGDLNRLYTSEPALHALEFEPAGFEWLDADDAREFDAHLFRERTLAETSLIVALNFTPVPRDNFRLGVPQAGQYRALLNSDSEFYGGANLGDLTLEARPGHQHRQSHYVEVTLPPLGGIVLKRC